MSKFIIRKSQNQQFYFVLLAMNGEIVITSGLYSSLPRCTEGIRIVQESSQIDNRFERKESKSGYYYFNIRSASMSIIATSEHYATLSGRENGINAVKRGAANASVVEQV